MGTISSIDDIFKVNKVQKINETNLKNSLYHNDANQTNNSKNTKYNHKRYSTTFEWDGEDQCVFLTGSFCDWEQFFEMKKSLSENNKFFLTLFLPKGIYQYKFKIGNKWSCNSNFPTCHDGSGNINNIIYLTEDNINNKIGELAKTDISIICISNEKKTDNNETKFISNLKLFEDEVKGEMGDNIQKPPSLLYTHSFDFLSNHNKTIKNCFLQCKEENILCDNYSYKKILPLKHELIDHFYINKNALNFNTNVNKTTLISGSAFKYRYKLTTFIYYKPVSSK